MLWTDYVRFCRNRRRELWGTSTSRRSKKKKGGVDIETEKRKEKEKEKAVLYRAVAACPWLRTAYMEAFRGRDGDEFRDLDLDEPEDDEDGEGDRGRGAMSSAELEALADTMVVKGLRVRVAVDEFVDEFAKDG